MAVFGCILLWSVFKAGVPLDTRIFDVLGAAVLLLIPFYLVRHVIQHRWNTGRWNVTPQERIEAQAQCATLRSRRGLTPPWSWFQFAAYWANYAAMEPTGPLWKRVAGWTVLLLFVAFHLSLVGIGVVFIGAALDDIKSFGFLFIGIGLALFWIPARVIWSTIRRYRETGSLRVHPEDMHQISGQIRESNNKERQRSLRYKLISTAFMVAILTAWWIRVYSPQHLHQNRVSPALWTLFGVYAIWNQFRKPKSSEPQSPSTTAATQG